MKKIRLGKTGKYALVDDIDFEYLSQFKWQTNGWDYAKRHRSLKESITRKDILMHREIMDAPEGIQIDHKDHNPLNNQRSNLRFSNQSQNLGNKRTFCNTSGYRGVSYCKRDKAWRAYIKMKNKTKALGTFKTPKDGAIAYNQAAMDYFGEFATLNQL